MEKKSVTVTLGGRKYTFASDESEAYMQRVAQYADQRLLEMEHMSNLPMAQNAILTCMNLSDELLKAQDEISMLRRRLYDLNEHAAEE